MSTKVHKPYAKYLFYLIPSRGDSDLQIKRIMALSVLCPKFHFENRIKFQDGVPNRGQNGGKKSKIFYKPSLGFHTITDSIPQVKKHRKNNLNPIATLKCSLLSFSRFRTLGSSHYWSFPPCFFWRFYTYQYRDFLLGLLQLIYLHCSIWPPSANAALAPHPRL